MLPGIIWDHVRILRTFEDIQDFDSFDLGHRFLLLALGREYFGLGLRA